MKTAYYFDEDSLQMVERRTSWVSSAVQKAKPYFWGSLVVSALAWGAMSFGFLPSIGNSNLQTEQIEIKAKLDQLNSRFADVEDFLSLVQYRDDSCFRVIAQKQPIPMSVRQPNFGGINKYESLESFPFGDDLVDANNRADYLQRRLNVQLSSYRSMEKNASLYNDSLLAMPAISPMAPHRFRISSSFGTRIHPILRARFHHDGVDFAAKEGTEIFATGNGVVTKVIRSKSGYGNMVVINHGYGYTSRYAHLSKIKVAVGDTVQRGTVIALCGNTGLSTGSHLHYEVISNGTKKDPQGFMAFDLNSTEFKEMRNAFAE